MSGVQHSFYLPDVVLNELKKQAVKEKRSVNWLVSEILLSWQKERERKAAK